MKTTGGVCLNSGKSGQTAFQPRAYFQNQAIGRLPKGIRFPRRWYGGRISANLEVIWEMSVNLRLAVMPWQKGALSAGGAVKIGDIGLLGYKDLAVSWV